MFAVSICSAELMLAALRPEDQDRRIHWLSDVVDGSYILRQATVGRGCRCHRR